MITSSQKQILETLKLEFEKMNVSKDYDFSDIIDISSIRKEYNDEIALKKQTNAFNEAFRTDFNKKVHEIAVNLNKTLLHLGLVVKEFGCEKNDLKITGFGHVCHSIEISIYSHYIYENDKIKCGAFYFYETPNKSSEKFTDIKNLIASKPFQLNLKRLYRSI